MTCCVLGVEVPLAACGLVALHQHGVLFAQGAVEVFEAYGFAVFGVGCELTHGGVEVPVVAHVQRNADLLGYGLD